MSDKYKNKRYLIEVGNVLILSSHLQSLLLYFLPLIQPGSIWLLNGILCHHVPKATFRDSHSTTGQSLTERRKNDNRSLESVFVTLHKHARRSGRTLTFFQLQKTTSQIHSYPSINQKLLTRRKTETLTNKTLWLWLNARCSYYFVNCLQCYLIILHFGFEQGLNESCLRILYSAKIPDFLEIIVYNFYLA